MSVDNSNDLKESAEMHREIYRAIRSRNPMADGAAMEQHLNLARMAQALEPKAEAKTSSPTREPVHEPAAPELSPAG